MGRVEIFWYGRNISLGVIMVGGGCVVGCFVVGRVVGRVSNFFSSAGRGET